MILDQSIRDYVIEELGKDEGTTILENMEEVLKSESTSLPNPSPSTKGDWVTNLPYNTWDIRPAGFLDYNIIEEMLKSGIIRFALDMKRAQMYSIFKSERSIKVHCPDDTLKKVTEAFIPHVLPRMAYEFTWSSLVYGSAFMEKTWEYKTTYEMGVSKGRTNKTYVVPKMPALVPHWTIKEIHRTSNGHFDGFTQDPTLKHIYIGFRGESTETVNEIRVPREHSLVIPYNGFSRNLWGESLLKPLYPLWFWYSIVMRSMVQFSQMMGDPPKYGKAPSRKKFRISRTQESVEAMEWLLAVVGNLKHTNVVIVPSDKDENGRDEWEIGYLDIPDRTQPFIQIIQSLAQDILRAALIADASITSATSGGSYALGEIHAEATAMHNQMTANHWLSYINEYFIRDISYHNHGEKGPPIWLEAQGLDLRERDFMQSLLGIAGNFGSIEEFFYMIDWNTLARLSGIPTFSEEEAQALKEKLFQENLDNQREQMSMAKEFKEASMKKDKDGNTDPVETVEKQLEFLNLNTIPITKSEIGQTE